MAGYLIYVPEVKIIDAGVLRRVGLDDLAHDRMPSSCELRTEGPDGGRGAIAFWHHEHDARANPVPVYDPPSQHWRAAKPDAERMLPDKRFWLGMEAKRPPYPTDLARSRMVRGREVILGDGNPWLVPIYRALPSRVLISDEGFLENPIDPRFASYEQDAEQIYRWLVPKEGEPGFPRIAGWEIAVQFLAMNYRVNQAVVDWLGLFDDSSLKDTLGAVIEFDAILDMIREQLAATAEKKTAEPEPLETLAS
jgi:hypothetical protein